MYLKRNKNEIADCLNLSMCTTIVLSLDVWFCECHKTVLDVLFGG